MGWLVATVHWQSIFWVMGGLGIILSFIWLKVIYSPTNHPTVNPEEVKYIASEGALLDMGENSQNSKKRKLLGVKLNNCLLHV